MKKETFTEKLIKRTYGISDPLDEYKRREADSIGNQVFIVLFYLMIFGNIIPLLLAYKYPQEVALIYPPLILVIALIASGYVTYQMKKEKKQLRYPGLKAGSIYGTVIFFIIPLIDTLTSENPNFISSLLNTKHIFKTILGAFFFGVMIHIVDSLRIARAKKDQD
ncbi:TPA: DUF3278 domain-containing protein [Streptococcus pneumoniae]